MNQISFVLLFLSSLFIACASPQMADNCSYDKEAMLLLDEKSFDQDLSNNGGGWRKVANIPGCELAAADLIAEYRAAHPTSGFMLAWHEGQMRASAGDYKRAILLLISAKTEPEQDIFGWNVYVDATVAFLEGNKTELLRARDRLLAVTFPSDADMPPLKNGYIEFPSQEGGPPIKMRWPPNIEVVDGFIACFGKSYSEAYGSPSCRHKGP